MRRSRETQQMFPAAEDRWPSREEEGERTPDQEKEREREKGETKEPGTQEKRKRTRVPPYHRGTNLTDIPPSPEQYRRTGRRE